MSSGEQDSRETLMPEGWTVEADVLPWEPVFAGPVVDAILGAADRADRFLARPDGRAGAIAEAELGEAVVAFVVAAVFGVAELVLLTVVWPLWWAYRRAVWLPLDLVIHDPNGALIETPGDLEGFSIKGRRQQVAEQIAKGLVRSRPVSADSSDLSCAGPGQPLIRRTRAVKGTDS